MLDENLDEQRVMLPLRRRHRGKIISIRDLRPGTVIKDDAIPTVLCQHAGKTFVTTNARDFWRRAAAHSRYCILCVPLPTERQDEIPDLLQKFLHHSAFRTARLRLGKVIRLSWSQISYYGAHKDRIFNAEW